MHDRTIIRASFYVNYSTSWKKSIDTLHMRTITNQIVLLNHFAIYFFIDYTIKFYVQNVTFQWLSGRKTNKLENKMFPLINIKFEKYLIPNLQKGRWKNPNAKIYISFWRILTNNLYLEFIFRTASTNTIWVFSFRF